MKIVCLIGRGAQHLYFVNRIHRQYPLALVVSESVAPSALRGWWNRLRTSVAMGSWGPMGGQPPITVRSRESVRICDAIFGPDWRSLGPDIPLFKTLDINGPEVLARLQELRPDILLVHGTSIVGGQVMGTAPLALNLHWGLSPYYRGTHCTQWALLDGDPHNIGVTIHRLERKIDGGEILAQGRPALDPADGVESINMKLTREGTGLVLALLGRLANGQELRFVKQDLTQGHLRLRRHWSGHLNRHLRRLLADGGLAAMLQRPARKGMLPIIEIEAADGV